MARTSTSQTAGDRKRSAMPMIPMLGYLDGEHTFRGPCPFLLILPAISIAAMLGEEGDAVR